jgi:glycosyltransferase involved in cell wall biosynthesis
MKITFCLFSMETGGAEILVVDLLNEISSEHNVSLIIINNRWNEQLLAKLRNTVKVYFINRTPGSRSLFPLVRLNMLLLTLQPDIVHCHDPKVAKLIKVRCGRLLNTVHDVGIPVSTYYLYDGLVAISETVHKDVTSRLNVPIKRIYNGIPVDRFRKRLDYSLNHNDSLKLVQISRLVHQKKGQDILVKALSILKTRFGYDNFSLDFVGSGDSEKYLSSLVTEHNLENNVRFVGERTREWVFENLAQYDLLIQPSMYEGFGLTIVEGLAAGIPVLASDIDGPAEIIAHMPAGFLFRKGNAENCAQKIHAIRSLYLDNKILPLVKQSQSLVKQEYSVRSCAQAYIEEYSALLTC